MSNFDLFRVPIWEAQRPSPTAPRYYLAKVLQGQDQVLSNPGLGGEGKEADSGAKECVDSEGPAGFRRPSADYRLQETRTIRLLLRVSLLANIYRKFDSEERLMVNHYEEKRRNVVVIEAKLQQLVLYIILILLV